MTLYLVRHAKAGSRNDWHDDDELRPLSKNGWKQANAIGRRLAKRSPAALITSPYVRCLQTLEPLAALTDLDVIIDERLTEGSDFEPVLELIDELPDGSVLCSHGDIVPATIAAIDRRGCVITTPADWRKGTIWRIERSAVGEFVTAAVWGPPR